MFKLLVFVCLLAVTMAAPKPYVIYALAPLLSAYSPAAYPAVTYPAAAYTTAAYPGAAYSTPIAYVSPYTAASSYYYARP